VKKIFYLLILLSLIRIFTFNINQGLWWDESVYLSLAKNICTGKGYQVSGFEKFRPPLLPFLIAPVYCVSKSIAMVKLALGAFYILSVYTTYLLARRLADEKTGFFAAVLFSANPLFNFFSLKVLSEPVFITFFNLALISFMDKRRNSASLFTALSCATRYFGAVLLPVYFLIEPKKIKENLRIAVVALLFLSPWLCLNYVNYGNPFQSFVENYLVHKNSKHTEQGVFYYLENSLEILTSLNV